MGQIVMLFGKPLEDCSREELELGVRCLGSLVESMRESDRFSREIEKLRSQRLKSLT